MHEHPTVTVIIVGPDGRGLGAGRLSDEVAPAHGRGHGGHARRLRAPLWMLCLGNGADLRLRMPDGTARRASVREVLSMDGPIATVRLQLTDGDRGTGDGPDGRPLASSERR